MRRALAIGVLLAAAAVARGQDRADLERRIAELEERLRRLEAARPTSTTVVPGTVPQLQGNPEAKPPSGEPEKATPGDPEGLRGAPGPVIRPPPEEKTPLESVLSALSEVRLYGIIEGSYVWNANAPRDRRMDANLLRTSDPDHDTFEVVLAKLGVSRAVNDANDWGAGFAFDVAVGRLVEKTLSLDPDFLPGSEINFSQAYVDLKAPTPWRPVTLRLGRFYGWFCAESLDPPVNPNYSHSFLFTLTPFTHTGASLSIELGAGFQYSQFLVNGWDVVLDVNDSKTLGGQLSWVSREVGLAVALNWIYGPELPENEHDKRYMLELAATWKPFDGTELRGVVHHGAEEGAALRGGTARWYAAYLVVRQEFFEVSPGFRRFAVAARIEHYRDEGGSRTGVDQSLREVTGTFEVRFTDFASLRLEYRRDESSRDGVFRGRRGRPSRDSQDTFAIELNARF